MNISTARTAAAPWQNFPLGDTPERAWSLQTTQYTFLVPSDSWTYRAWVRSRDGTPIYGRLRLEASMSIYGRK